VSIVVQLVIMALDVIIHTLVLVGSWMIFCLVAPDSARTVAGAMLRLADKRLAEKAERARRAS
jgi:hypothetical protein